VITGERWWLFFSGYDGSNDNRRAAILAAISQSGASWDRVGTVLNPDEGELAVSHPCVPIREIARRHQVHRRAVRQAIRSAVPPQRKRTVRSRPNLTEEVRTFIDGILLADRRARRRRPSP